MQKNILNGILGLFFALAATSAFAGDVVFKVATKGDDLAYDKTEFSAKAGQKVKVTFTNKAKKDTGMQHNFVLTQPGKSDEVANASLAAGPGKNWIAESPAIIAHTKLLNSGESETITFTAPKAGDYPFICTFPGHSALMKGVMHVK